LLLHFFGLFDQVSHEFLHGRGKFLHSQLKIFGIELGEVVSSHLFNRESGSLNVDLAFTNPADSFSPMQISNTMLYLQYTRLDNDRYEVLAYLT
jgi:hypothetical protein